jgi:hypothetical protein
MKPFISKTFFSKNVKRRHDTQHNNSQHTDTGKMGLIAPFRLFFRFTDMLSVIMWICFYSECHYAERRYVECYCSVCHYAGLFRVSVSISFSTIIPSVIILSVIVVIVTAPSKILNF